MSNLRHVEDVSFFQIADEARQRTLREACDRWNGEEKRRAKLDAKRMAKHIRAAQEQARLQAIAYACLPSRALKVLTPTIEPSKARDAVKACGWGMLVLSGGCGTGKTVAAVEWLNDRVGSTSIDAPLFVSATTLAMWQRYDWAQMQRLFMAERLVIDDLGTEFSDERGSFRSTVDGVVNERYANERPTLITTNCGKAEFVERYGARIIDRFRECGRFVVVGSESMRGKNAKRV